METVEIKSTSRQTADCSEIVLRNGPLVRLIFRPQLVENPREPDACLKGRFIYQRKAKNDKWEDADAPSLASLKQRNQGQGNFSQAGREKLTVLTPFTSATQQSNLHSV